MKHRWRLFEHHFTKPGEYSFGEGGNRITFQVDKNRIFEIDGPCIFPLYVIAERV